MRLLRLVISLFILLLPLSVTAQGRDAQIGHFRSEMYRLYSTDSLEKFMAVTDRLKELTRQSDERLFYRAWSNQVLYTFRKVDRKKGQAMLEEERQYAQQHNSKFGLYASTSANATMMSMLDMREQAEQSMRECVEYVHRYFPGESAAADLLGLARMCYNRRDYRGTLECAEATLKEPKLIDTHRQSALAYQYLALSHLLQAPLTPEQIETLNKTYAEWKAYFEKSKRSIGIEDIVEFNHARINGDYPAVLEIAKGVKTKANRLSLLSVAYELNGQYQNAYYTMVEWKKYNDSVNSAQARTQANEHALQLNIAKAEGEAKDLRLANQALELSQISYELEQRRLEEKALNLSLQKRESELAHAATKQEKDSLDKHNKDLQLREYQAEMEARRNAEQKQFVMLASVAVLGVLTIAYLIFYLYRRRQQLAELKVAYDKLEETTSAKERIDSELRIARDIQMSMVPRTFPAFPERKDIDLYALMVPAKEVGGDLYDYFLQNDRLFFCVGDVSGKGVPASMTMAVAVNLFRTVAKEGFPPEYIATKLNDTLSADNESGMFVTMFIGEIDLNTGRFDYCNAGHTPPLIGHCPDKTFHPSDITYEFLEMESNVPVGLWPDVEFVGEHIDHVKGCPLFIYTDGVSEAENSHQEQFGEERMQKVLNHARQPLGERQPKSYSHFMIGEMKRAVDAHVNGAAPNDDLTILCIKVL